MTVINFFLTRHGETQWNKIGKFQGQLDSPLTEKGCSQAYAIATNLILRNINHIVSSTLPRAQKTAETCLAVLNCSTSLDSRLIERNFGNWQGKFINEVKLDNNYQAIFHQVNTIAPPNGESGIDCAKRFQQS
jgi:broad specificity phosphatase PhoE